MLLVINQVAYSINLLFLGSKKAHRANHPYPRPKNSGPLSQTHNNIDSHPTSSIYPPPQMDLDPSLAELQENVTQPQWDVGPLKTNDGYEGRSKHFGVKMNVIKIKNTDAVPGNAPNEEQRQLSVNERGNFSQYIQQTNGDDTYQLWMRKIGPYLADWVLQLPRHGAFPAFFSPPQVCTDNMACDTREPPVEAHEIPKALHALGPRVRRHDRPRQPSPRRLSIWRAALGTPFFALPIECNDLPLPNGVRPPRHMAHEGQYGPMRLQILHPRPEPKRHKPSFESWCRH